MGIRFLTITQLFLANRAEISMGTQKTIIYRLVLRIHDFEAFLKTNLAGKMGAAASLAPKGLGPQGPTK